MKKLLTILGGLFLVLIIVGGAVFGYVAYRGFGLDSSSKAYVDETIPIIVSSWSKAELLKRCSPQLLDIANKNPQQIDQLFNKLTTLGALKHYNGSKGQAFLLYDATKGKMVTADYVADANFEHGDAHFQIRLIQSSGHWQYLLFNVNSPIFLQ